MVATRPSPGSSSAPPQGPGGHPGADVTRPEVPPDAGLVGVLVAGLACLWALPAAAQPAGRDAPVGVELVLQGGVFAPGGDLVDAREGESFGSVGVERSLALGAAAGLRLPPGVVIEVQGLWTPDAGLEDENGNDFGDVDLLGVTAVGLYRFSPPGVGALVQPFFGGGAGVKRYSFDPAVFASPTGGVDQPGDLGLEGTETDFTLELVVGARLTLLPGFRVRLEARDYLSGFARDRTSAFQNDLTFLAGFGVGLP